MAWDKNKPAGSQKLRLSDDEIRANQSALEDALKNGAGLEFETGGPQTGKLKTPTFKNIGADPTPPSDSGDVIVYNISGQLKWIKSTGEVQIIAIQDANGYVQNAYYAINASNAGRLRGYDLSTTPAANAVPLADSAGHLNSWINQGAGSGLDADKIRGLNGDFTCSKSTNGYTKLPNGIIIQWGLSGSVPGSGSLTIYFPIAFPNACFSVVTVPVGTGSGGGSSDFWGVAQVTNQSFRVYNAYDGAHQAYWIAVGH